MLLVRDERLRDGAAQRLQAHLEAIDQAHRRPQALRSLQAAKLADALAVARRCELYAGIPQLANCLPTNGRRSPNPDFLLEEVLPSLPLLGKEELGENGNGSSMSSTLELPLPYRREPTCPFDPAADLCLACTGDPIIRVPLASGKRVWLITRHSDACAVLGDIRFSSALTPPGVALPQPGARTLAEELRDRQPGTFLEYDPPEHTRLRRLAAGEFSASRMRRLRPRVEEIVNERLDAMEAAGPPVDLIESFALPVPSQVICELLGVPFDDGFDFARHTQVMTDVMAPPESLLHSRDAMRGYMRSLVKSLRKDPATICSVA